MTGGVKSHDCQPPMLDDSLPRGSSSFTTLTKSSILFLPGIFTCNQKYAEVLEFV